MGRASAKQKTVLGNQGESILESRSQSPPGGPAQKTNREDQSKDMIHCHPRCPRHRHRPHPRRRRPLRRPSAARRKRHSAPGRSTSITFNLVSLLASGRRPKESSGDQEVARGRAAVQEVMSRNGAEIERVRIVIDTAVPSWSRGPERLEMKSGRDRRTVGVMV